MTEKLVKLIAELEKNIRNYDKLNEGISRSTIGWHIEHSLLTIDRVIERLTQADSRNYKWRLSFLKIIVFVSKTIPRGKGKSPDTVKPKAEITKESLSNHISETKTKVSSLSSIGKDQFFEHPYFGHLKLKQAITFLEIHTTHHLKIIKDILK